MLSITTLCKLVAIKMTKDPQPETRSENMTEEDNGCENVKHPRESRWAKSGVCRPFDNTAKEVTSPQERTTFVGGHSGCVFH